MLRHPQFITKKAELNKRIVVAFQGSIPSPQPLTPPIPKNQYIIIANAPTLQETFQEDSRKKIFLTNNEFPLASSLSHAYISFNVHSTDVALKAGGP